MSKFEFAERGWVVEVFIELGSKSEAVHFAVTEDDATQAALAVCRYPGIVASDVRSTIRTLSAEEISSLQLRPGAVRPFRRATVRSSEYVNETPNDL